MHKVWITAGILNILAALLHLSVGYIGTLQPVLQSNLDDAVKATITVVWYMTALLMGGSSWVLLQAGISPNQIYHKTIILIGLIYMVIAILFIFYGLPQWLILGPVSILSLYGVMTQSKSDILNV